LYAYILGTIHKRCPQLGGGCPMRTFCRQGGFFRWKNIGFFEFYLVAARNRGESVEPVRTKGREGQFFAILCGRPLWTAPYLLFSLKCLLTP